MGTLVADWRLRITAFLRFVFSQMINVEVAKRLRSSVCAVGYLTVPLNQHRLDPANPDFFIVGTAFLVSETTVLTNRHVLEAMYDAEDNLSIPKDQFFISFVYPRIGEEPNWQLCYTTVGKSIIPQRENVPDIGFIQFSIERSTDDNYERQCKPVVFDDLQHVNIGDPVAMWGYPGGTALLQPSFGHNRREKLTRIGPVLQQGFISGAAPFEVEPGTHEFLLDIRTFNGMSGSPVFNPTTGKVIGVHYKGNKSTTSVAFCTQ
jgi:hypothetical protein